MKHSIRTLVCGNFAAAGVAAVSVVAFAGVKSTKDGAFTASQAERGRAIYEKSCEGCHKPDIQVRLSKFEGRPVSEMLEVVSTSMPADNPGSLALSEYLDAFAYIFSITGSPAGAEELTTETAEAINIGSVK